MATEGFVRRPRIAPPRAPGGEVALTAPPEIPRPVPTGLLMKLMPVVMVVAVIGMIAMMVMMGRNLLANPFMMMFPMMMIMSMVGMMAGFRGGTGGPKKAAELNEERKDYFRYLDQVRKDVRKTGTAQLTALLWSHPDPADLQSIAGTRRMWERRPNDPDFGHVRVGVGSHRLATKLARPETGPLEDLEPVSTVALRRFVRTHSVVHGLPTAISLRAFPAINIEGDHDQTRMLVRSMVMEFATFHGPDHAAVAIICADPDAETWSWAKWLPHLQHPVDRDGMGTARMMYRSLAELETAMAAELLERGRFMRNAQPTAGRVHLLVIIDDGYVSGSERIVSDAGLDSVTVLDLTAPQAGLAVRRGLQLVVADGMVAAKSAAGVEKFATADAVTRSEAESLARDLARYRIATAAQIVSLGDETRAVPGLMALLKIPDAARIDPAVVWRPRSDRERLRVPIGITPDGTPVEIDIKESAENGMGPHGLCIGATGSGKSEFLRTLVLSLVTTHSPDLLNLVLVDFKGGATFLGLESLPHVAAVITNLEEELSMVDRMKDALAGEMNRRQELLRAAGNFANVTEYEKARAAGAQLDPLPALFVVVDEFSELLSQKPDFADLFVMIGRLGRSLRVHLLLASQRLEENKLRGLDSHLSYRIGLRTFSANESRAVLGITDAYHLPSVPGSGYLKSDADDPLRFNAAYVSGPYVSPRGSTQIDGEAVGGQHPVIFTASEVEIVDDPANSGAVPAPAGLPDLPPAPGAAELSRPGLPDLPPPPGGLDLPPPPPAGGPELPAPPGVDDSAVAEPATSAQRVPATLLQVVVERLTGHGRPAHEVWLPPLDESPSVDMLLPDPDWRSPVNQHGQLWLPIGVIDKPYEQRRDVLIVDLAGAQGNMAVVGGPQSGKSTTLRTIIMAAAATHTPEQVQFYCLDFGGGTLMGLADLPHVGSVAGRMDVDRVRRTIAEVTTLLRQREERFRELGVESIQHFRRRKAELLTRSPEEQAADPLSEDQFGDVFLVVDGWSTIRGEYDTLEASFNALAAQGLSYGIHLIIAASRWPEIRPAIKDLIGTRLELRLGDPADSEMDRRTAVLVPVGRPGRGLTPQKLHMLVALPRLDSSSDPGSLSEGIAAAKRQFAEMYGERRAPDVRMLPLRIPRAEVLAIAAAQGIEQSPTRVVIGLGENELSPLVLDFDAQPHLMAFADVECGKTTLLRNIVLGVTENSTAETARVILIDYRRTMLGVIEGDQLAGYSTSSQTSVPMIKEVANYLAKRFPPPDITPQQLRDRSWWTGPEIYIVVDDYDMVATSQNPLDPLMEYLPQARDIGMHLIVARRSGGAARALYDKVLGRMKDLSVDGLLMSAPKDEGKLLGDIRATRLPPGRGTLVSRGEPQMIQVSYLDPN
ncbi:type VII secretion protein EccCa [Nocardia puris]|uniref:type VII secretion protein EccCa n=1 Tax=Nocardia puris TaxID=208602 RepID=UPI0018948303|nr:type VII secretion protein EccCa [Nocardia puris]MBF6212541.1 type VII secretion protein EccCa [Nocardia puris]MBF6366788.1 type VII secretion protein EccCa [Nocardia puris]MBF6461129.1 type VII secretion protein EccCa [Nocardia puris]